MPISKAKKGVLQSFALLLYGKIDMYLRYVAQKNGLNSVKMTIDLISIFVIIKSCIANDCTKD